MAKEIKEPVQFLRKQTDNVITKGVPALSFRPLQPYSFLNSVNLCLCLSFWSVKLCIDLYKKTKIVHYQKMEFSVMLLPYCTN